MASREVNQKPGLRHRTLLSVLDNRTSSYSVIPMIQGQLNEDAFIAQLALRSRLLDTEFQVPDCQYLSFGGAQKEILCAVTICVAKRLNEIRTLSARCPKNGVFVCLDVPE